MCITICINCAKERFPNTKICSSLCGISDFLSTQFPVIESALATFFFHSSCLFVSGLFLSSSLLGPLPPRWMDMASFSRIPFLHSTLRALPFSQPKVHIVGWEKNGRNGTDVEEWIFCYSYFCRGGDWRMMRSISVALIWLGRTLLP